MKAAGWRHIFVASLARRRLASALCFGAIALGVALGLAVQLIHASALDEFDRGMRRLAGQADLQVLGPRGGFDDALFVALAQAPEVAAASPVLEVDARRVGSDASLRLYGIDVFRAGAITPQWMPQPAEGQDRFAMLAPDRLFLSAAARVALGLEAGDAIELQGGLEAQRFTVAGGVPGATQGDAFGVLDLSAAQRRFGQAGRLTRIDLRLVDGMSPATARELLAPLLSPGVALSTPDEAVAQAAGLSRAYRVNMAMLAAIALLTGGFLVFAAQWLSVVRRRQEFAVLRAMGMSRAMLMRGLIAEGAVVGLAGGLAGVLLAHALAAAAFAFVGGDLGAGMLVPALGSGVVPEVSFQPLASLAYLGLGVVVGAAGAWLPAREAAMRAPARALRAGDEVEAYRGRPRARLALGCAVLALALSALPAADGVPLGGYAAVALVLCAAVFALPGAVRMLATVPGRRDSVVLRLARTRLAAAPGQAVVGGAGVVASVALAVAMAVMVSSFRVSLDDWLDRVLPADVYVRASPSAQSGFLDADAVARISAVPGVAEAQPVRYDRLRLAPGLAPMTLIARDAEDGAILPLVEEGPRVERDLPSAWLSEAAGDLLGLAPGARIELPLAGASHAFRVAGVWRDYARQHGAIVIELAEYRRITGDTRTNDLGLRIAPGASAAEVVGLVAGLPLGVGVEVSDPSNIRATSLAIFDRTFLVTWLMEAVAVLIGLFGVVTTFAALAVSRGKEFGVLRHLGLERRRVGTLLAAEGALTAFAGVAVGMLAGLAIALILVFVINRQSFHWSMDLVVPIVPLLAFGAVLVALAAMAARLAGANAMRRDAVLAVKEDW